MEGDPKFGHISAAWSRKSLQFRQCLAFFTRMPASLSARLTSIPKLAEIGWCLPWLGLLVGLIAGLGMALIFAAGGSSLLAALSAVCIQVLVTGGLHEDGLADTVDAFGGGHNPAHALDILNDSRIGAFGATALILTLGLRVALLDAMLSHGILAAVASLGLAASLSRLAMLAHSCGQSHAREEGIAKTAGSVSGRDLLWPLAGSLIILLVVWLSALPWSSVVFAAAMGLLAWGLLSRLARLKLGGVTGDTHGATQQFSEIAVLFGIVLFF